MIVSLVVAMAENRVIGRDGDLPWRLPADLRFFKRLTTGHTVIMGRKTFESIAGPLPDRRNVVLTRQPGYRRPGITVAHDLDAALALAPDDDEVFVLGGEEVYRLALPRAERLYITLVHAQLQGDTHFPPIDDRDWILVDDERHPADTANPFPYSFRRYRRRT